MIRLQVISNKTARAIVNRNKQFDRLQTDHLGRVVGVRFNQKTLIDYHIKIFKGLFYHEYEEPIPDEYTIVATFSPTDFTSSCVNYLESNFDWKPSGHPDVFDYILQPFREGLKNPHKADFEPEENEPYYLSLQRYNSRHATLVIATNRFLT